MESENSKAEKRKGKALNRLSILSVPVPKTRHFWHNRLLDVLILEQVFDGSAEDFANYQKLDASTRRTLWRAQTQFKKLSLFAEEFFRRLANETGTRMLARKGDLHELVALCDPAELNGEVREKLDAMQRLLNP